MRRSFLFSISILIIISGCSVLQTFENIARLKYKIHSASDYQISGINPLNKKSLKDFSALEMLKLTSAVAKGSMPLVFTLNIEAKNPNDGASGSPRTDISITSLPWKLFVNDNQLVAGNISEPIFVPGKGESMLIPIKIEFDILKSLKDRSLEDVFNLLLNVGGVDGSTSNLKLKIQPVLGTPVGNIGYPSEITVVDKTFN
ncbi:MAG: LEA type 2 family protein [Melioribacteraceae bacterium]|nr:LEA type 2 family protein [Melioribacteraceae bacterium]